jgi:EmrB/QacA subfamily drug resistance transporter
MPAIHGDQGRAGEAVAEPGSRGPVPAPAGGPTDGAADGPDPRRWRALPAILVASFMSLFDVFVVNVAAPSIGSDLHASDAALELVIAGYSFTYAAGLVTGGRLGDRFGRRSLFLSGMGLFTISSALCGLAPDEATLIVGRLLQGIGAAAMVPQVLALISVIFPPAERPRAFAMFGVTIGLGAVSGQVIGGVLLNANLFGLGWRPIFLVNVPIGLITMVMAGRLVRESKAHTYERLDLVGLAGLTVALGLVLVPLTMGRDEGWPLWTWLALAGGAIALAVFGSWEARVARSGGAPIVPPAVLRTRRVLAGLLTSAGFFLFFGSFLLAFTIFLQNGQHRSPLNAGLVFGPLGVTFALSSVAARRLVARYGARVLTAGTLISFLAIGGMTLLLAQQGVDVSTTGLVPLLMLAGVGNGLTVPALVATVLSGVPADIAGAVSGVLTTTQQFSSALGVAGVGALFFSETAHGGPADGLLAALICDLGALTLALLGTLALPRPAAAPAAAAVTVPAPARAVAEPEPAALVRAAD